MKTAIDSTPLSEVGGIRRYTVELHRALTEEFAGDEFELLSDQGRTLSGLDRRWWVAGLPRHLLRHRFNVFHGTDFSAPYLPVVPTVMTVHDLSPWRGMEGSDRVRRRTPWLLRFGLATMVITDSKAVRREVLDYFGLMPEEVVAVPLAASDHFRPTGRPAPARRYFLYVGALEARKNLGVLIDAWQEVRKSHDIDLLLAGKPRPNFVVPSIDGLRALGETPEEDLPKLYSGACAVVYPSLYEGFGLPVLEAMQCGAPVIASTDPAIAELSGDACILKEPGDVRGFRDAMAGVLTNPELRGGCRDRSLRRAGNYSWRSTARQTHAVYRTAIRRFHG